MGLGDLVIAFPLSDIDPLLIDLRGEPELVIANLVLARRFLIVRIQEQFEDIAGPETTRVGNGGFRVVDVYGDIQPFRGPGQVDGGIRFPRLEPSTQSGSLAFAGHAFRSPSRGRSATR